MLEKEGLSWFFPWSGPRLLIPEMPHLRGGPETFIWNLCRGLEKRGFRFTRNLSDKFSQVFFPIEYDESLLRTWRKKGVRIIQRLDGVYYSSKHGDTFQEKNEKLETIYSELADLIVYQSAYSQKQCEAVLRPTCARYVAVILNGADPDIFFPVSDREQPRGQPLRCITTGHFRNLDMLEPVFNILGEVDSRVPEGVELTCVGPITHPVLREMTKGQPAIRLIEKLDHEGVAEALRRSDLFLYSHLNPPCPNSVIEAICSGLPVVGFDSGALSELCGDAGILAPVSCEVLQRYEQFNAHQLSDCWIAATARLSELREKARMRRGSLLLNRMIDEYITCFQS